MTEEERAELESSNVGGWFVPLTIVWAGVLLSAWVYMNKIPQEARELSLRIVLTFLGTPFVALIVFLVFRLTARRTDTEPMRAGNLLIIWVMTFLFGVHASVLAVAIRLLDSLDQALPIATGLLLIGLGPVVGGLEPGSSMGIRTKKTLASEALWRRTHRLASILFIGAGILGFVSLFFEGRWVMFGAVGPALIAVILSILYPTWAKPEPEEAIPEKSAEIPENLGADEQEEAEDRQETREDSSESGNDH